VTAPAEVVDDLAAGEPGAANHDDLHECSPCAVHYFYLPNEKGGARRTPVFAQVCNLRKENQIGARFG